MLFRFSFLVCLIAYLLLLSSPIIAQITVDGETVHVETDSYAVRFDKGVIAHIHNRLTDVTYTVGEGRPGWSGMLYDRYYWKDVNIDTRWATFVSATAIDPFRAVLVFRQEDAEVRLFISIDRATDDMLINIEGESETPGVVGLQWGCSYLDIENVSFILPMYNGRVVDSTHEDFYFASDYPSEWEAQLVIAQGEEGGFYVRNTDNTFQFKRVTLSRYKDEAATLNFVTYNQSPFDAHTGGKSDLWRFNTYRGDWHVPARIYRDWMEQAFDARRLSDMPAWVQDISLFVSSANLQDLLSIPLLDRLAELVDPTRTVVMLASWADGGEWWSDELGSHHPDYIPKPGMKEFVETAHQYGFKVVPWMIACAFSADHPLYPHFRQYQWRDTWTGELIGTCWAPPLDPACYHPSHDRAAAINPASSEFRDLLVQGLKAVWEEYGVDGFFVDASWKVINDGNGLIEGLNMAQGMDLLHRELAEAMPGIILGGERLNEACFARKSFAQRPRVLDAIEPHPISSFLFSPFTYAIGFPKYNPDDRPDLHQQDQQFYEVWDVVPTIKVSFAGQLEDHDVEIHNIIASAQNWQPDFEFVDGDLNNDAEVNILDLIIVANNFEQQTPSNSKVDVNKDGQVNILDLVFVSQHMSQ